MFSLASVENVGNNQLSPIQNLTMKQGINGMTAFKTIQKIIVISIEVRWRIKATLARKKIKTQKYLFPLFKQHEATV